MKKAWKKIVFVFHGAVAGTHHHDHHTIVEVAMVAFHVVCGAL